MLRSLGLLLIVVVVLYGVYLALLYTQQRGVLFPGAGLPAAVANLPEGAQEVGIEASFGQVRGVLLRAPTQAARAPAALYFHGNYELVAHNLQLLQPVADLGLHVLLVEYPGYAGSDGQPSRASLAEAAQRAYDWLVQRPDVDAGRIVAIGRSIGSGPAVDLATERPLRALVLLAAFTSIADFAGGLGAPRLLIRDPFDNRRGLQDFEAPVLLFHGRRDEVIPFAQGEALAGTAPRATLVPMDCRHNDCAFFGEEFLGVLRGFLIEAEVLPDSRVELFEDPAGNE